MEKTISHPHSNIANIRSYCRNRRQTNSNLLSGEQQKVQEAISAKTTEFHEKLKVLQWKLTEVKHHVKQTKNRLNSMRHYL
jgi:hypothetical protein